MLKVGGKQEDIIRNIQNKFNKLNSNKNIDSTIVIEFMIYSYQYRKRKMLWRKILRLAVYSKM